MRLMDYDYSTPGAYFVTIVSYRRFPIFGKIVIDKVPLNQVGRIVEDCWLEIPFHFPFVRLKDYVVMPNHLHGVIEIKYYPNVDSKEIFARRNTSKEPKQSGPQSQSLSAIIGSYKSATTKCVHRLGLTHQKTRWQRNYYEHVIRDDEDYQRIVEYIQLNPVNWEDDQEYIMQ